ncbi:phage tail tape measure protein [Lactiplantibacillus plantarum]|nr:phage tail tape measure protein [Lactiplantibacillus plantarum]
MTEIAGYRYRFDIADSGFREAIKEMRASLRSLKQTTNATFTEFNTAGDKATAFKEKVKLLGQQIKAENEILKSAKGQYAELTSSLNRQETVLKSSVTRQKELGNTLESTENKLKRTKTVLGEDSDEYRTLNQQVAKLKTDYREQTETVAKANKAYENTRKYLNTTGDQITRTRREIASLTAQQEKSTKQADYYQSGIDDIRSALKRTAKENTSYVNQLKSQGNVYSAQKAKLSGLRKQHRLLGEQITKEKSLLKTLSDKYGENSSEVQTQRTQINKLTTDYNQESSAIGKLNVKYGKISTGMASARDTAAKAANKVKASLAKYKSAAVTATAAIATLGAATVSGAKKASTLQNIYKQNQNLLTTSGESAKTAIKAVTEMQKDGQKYSVKYGISQKTIAENYQDLIKRGHTAKEALAVMKTELQGSVASGDDFNDVTKVSSQVIEAFGMKTNNTAKMVKNTKRVVNDLAYTADTTATDFQSLGKGMEYVSETASNAGFSVEETSAALGELSNHGLEADKAGTGLRKVITSLAKPTDTATGALKKIGITSTSIFKKSNGDFKSMTSIMGILEKHVKGLGGSEKAAVFKAIFGSTGMAAAQILAKNSTALGKLTKKVSEAGKEGEYVQKLANKNSSTAQMNVKRFKQAAEALETMMGAKLLPVMTEAANKMTVAFNNKSVQNGLKTTVGLIADLLEGTLKVVEFFGNHTKTLKVFGTTLAGIWGLTKINKFIHFLKDIRTNLGLVATTAKKTAITDTIMAETDALKSQNEVLEANKELSNESTLGSVTGSTEKLEQEANEVGEVATATETATTKTTLWGRALTKLKGGWTKLAPLAIKVVSKIVTVAGAALSAWDLGKSIAKAVNKPTTTNKVKVASKTLGTVIGGVLGSFGGPWGTVIGATIGEQLGSTKTANKIVAGLGKSLKRAQTYYKDHKTVVNADGTTTVKLTVAGEAKKQMAALKKTFNSLPTATKSAVKKANSEFKKLNVSRLKLGVSLNKSSLKKSSTAIIKAVNSLYKEIKNKAKNHASSAAKEAQKLYKAGLINKSDLKKTEKLIKSHYTSTTKSAKSAAQKIKKITKSETSDLEENTKERGKAINKVESHYSAKRASMATEEKSNIAKIKRGQTVTLDGIEYSGQKGINKIQKAYSAKRQKLNSDEGKAINEKSESYSKTRKGIYAAYAKSYVNQEEKLGISISKTLTSSSKAQKAIMTKLKSAKGKISQATADKLIEDSYQTAKKSIKNADDDYTAEKAKAENKKNSLIKYANDTYTGNSAYAVKMRKKLTDEANTQYKNSVSAAKQTKTETEAQIAAQEKTTVNTAKKQAKGITTHAVKQGNNTIEAAGKGASGSANIFSGLLKWLGKIKWLTGVNESSGAFNPNVYKISGMSYARGTGNGTVGRSGMALVGEQGPELAYNANKGVFRILGANGAEVSKVDGHESVLNAKDTAKVLSGGYGKDKVLPGFASGTSTLSNFFKSITKNATKLYKSLSKTVKAALKHPIKTVESLLKGITSIKVPNKGWVNAKTWEKGYNGVGKTVLKDAKKLLKKIAKVVTGSDAGDVNNPSGSGVTRWKPVIRKVANNMNVDLTGNGMSHILSRIKQESNGSPTVENDWDSNAKAGHPSIGLLQYIEPTFKAWLPTKSGHKYPDNIKHGTSQIAAMFNDSSWLSDISVSGGWGPTGHKRYANGGFSSIEKLAHISEGNQLEAIIPMSSQKGSRGYELLGQVATMFAARDKNKLATTGSTNSNTDTTSSQMLTMMSKMVTGLNNIYAAQYDTALTKGDIYKVNQQVKKQQTRIKNFATE